MGSKTIIAGLSLFLCSPLPALLAQGAVNTPGSPTAGSGATQTPAEAASPASGEAERVIINDVPIEESILPTTRPTNSVYGLDTSVQDTPRNVTIISREQLSAIDIQDPRDFSKLTSDSYTQSNFGAPANPSIRGQTADVFVNGMRRGLTSNGNGFPIDFNSVESVDIIKGPANAVYGASQYVGGYVDEVTKQPYFDKFQGNVGTTIGEYQVYRWTADFGGPLIKDKLAYRVSYTGEDSGSYYDNAHKQSEAVYLAATWMPTSKFTLAISGEYNEADYNENNGINRVTQNLIDNDKYITGTVPGGSAAIQPFFNPVVTTGQVDIDHALHIIGADDGSYGHTEYVQALQTLNVSDNFKIINNTLFERIDRRTFNSQQFDEVLKNNSAVDDRLEFIFDTDIPIFAGTSSSSHPGAKDGKDAKDVAKDTKKDGGLTFHNQLNTGLEFRYQNNTNYDTFADEPFNAFDITKPISTVYIPTASVAAAFPGQYHIPGLPSQYLFTPLNGDNAHSNLYEFGPYFQDILKFTDQFSLLFGGRADILYVDSKTPPGTPASQFKVMSTTQVLPSANISPTYKPVPWLTTYFTFNFSQSTNTGDGGDYSPTFTPQDFHQPSFLYEVGAKFSLLKNTLYFTTTGYVQNRQNPSQGGTSVKVNVKGLEFETDYQPNKHFYATASYSFLDAHTIDPGFTHEAFPITTNASVPPGTVLLTDVPTFGAGLPNGFIGHFRTPGYPQHLFNTLVSYKTDFGLGVTADMQVTSPMTVSYDGTIKIPWQYNVDLSVFYQFKRYEARVGVYNVTNQHNWNPANPIYGNESIFAEEPIHVEGTFKIKF